MTNDQAQVRAVQAVLLSIFKEIKKICDRHGLRYFAIGGTLIGAVRHRGFIPWDDDLDLAMPEEDYRRFIIAAKEELPSNLRVFERREHAHDCIDAARVHDVNTTFIQGHDVRHPEEYKGVFVDILPLYGVPEDRDEQRKYCKKFCRYYRFNDKRRSDFSHMAGLKPRLMWIAASPLRLILPRDFWYKRLDRLKARYPYEKMTMTGDTWVAHIDNILFPKSVYETSVSLPFEDTEMNCSAHYDEYLTRIFGDYMTPPPEDKRGEEHASTAVVIDAERPYSYYQQMFLEKGTIKKEFV